MPYQSNCDLWSNSQEVFFRDRTIVPQKQVGPHCTSTVLAMLSGESPAYFQERINTQDPVSWNDALATFGIKLAYCPTDIRKIKHYVAELVTTSDLFTLSYYKPKEPSQLLDDPNEKGWICGSHIVICHLNNIIDPATGLVHNILDHNSLEFHTKRIFRVVPLNHPRGI
jgi:hypothetical protein